MTTRRNKPKRLLACAFMALSLTASEIPAQDSLAPLTSCLRFQDVVEQYDWWSERYGATLATGSLLLDDTQQDSIRLGQLFLMLRELAERNQTDLQKHLAIELEIYQNLEAALGGAHLSVIQLLGTSVASSFGAQDIGIEKVRLCAFQCPSGGASRVSNAFEECLAK